jgi:hypothetical protein
VTIVESTRERRARDRREARRARRRRWFAVAGGIVLGGLLFFAGLAVGRALEEAPEPGGTQTLVRTLEPGTLPAVTQTVTVTTTP